MTVTEEASVIAKALGIPHVYEIVHNHPKFTPDMCRGCQAEELIAAALARREKVSK